MYCSEGVAYIDEVIHSTHISLLNDIMTLSNFISLPFSWSYEHEYTVQHQLSPPASVCPSQAAQVSEPWLPISIATPNLKSTSKPMLKSKSKPKHYS